MILLIEKVNLKNLNEGENRSVAFCGIGCNFMNEWIMSINYFLLGFFTLTLKNEFLESLLLHVTNLNYPLKQINVFELP